MEVDPSIFNKAYLSSTQPSTTETKEQKTAATKKVAQDRTMEATTTTKKTKQTQEPKEIEGRSKAKEAAEPQTPKLIFEGPNLEKHGKNEPIEKAINSGRVSRLEGALATTQQKKGFVKRASHTVEKKGSETKVEGEKPIETKRTRPSLTRRISQYAHGMKVTAKPVAPAKLNRLTSAELNEKELTQADCIIMIRQNMSIAPNANSNSLDINRYLGRAGSVNFPNNEKALKTLLSAYAEGPKEDDDMFVEFVVGPLLDTFFEMMGMVKKDANDEIILDDSATKCKDGLIDCLEEKKKISINKGFSPSIETDDDMRAPMQKFIETSLKSNDPQVLKLGFLLYGFNQNWIVGPGLKMGLIVNNTLPDCKLMTLHEKTRINFSFADDGSVQVSMKGTHVDDKFKSNSQDAPYQIDTIVTLTLPANATSIKMFMPEFNIAFRAKHEDDPDIQALVANLKTAGFNVAGEL